MKFVRLIAMALIVALLASFAIGCSQNPPMETTNAPTEAPTDPVQTDPVPVETVLDFTRDVGVTINNQGNVNDQVIQLLKDHGITYVRIVFPYPFGADGITPNAGYLMAKTVATKCYNAGIKIMGQTMWPGGMGYDAAVGAVVWHSYYPEVFEDYDDEYFYKMVKSAAKYMAKDLKDICNTWLISNEPDISTYTGPMSFKQIVRFIQTSVDGVKEGNPAASCGVNMLVEVYEAYSLKFVRELYQEDDRLDWLGLDGYYATLQAGGPETWEYYINTFYEAAQVPIVITEWSYSSAESDPLGTCKHQWEGHGARGPAVQAEYVTACMEVFAQHPEVIGTFWYALHNEDGVCWECGDPQCNLYSSWGLLNSDSSEKPALDAMLEASKLFKKAS